VALKEHRRRIAPAALPSYRGHPCSVNAFGRGGSKQVGGAVKLLARLNFLHSTLSRGWPEAVDNKVTHDPGFSVCRLLLLAGVHFHGL